ncbi:MAG: choline-glycine betaine transporter [Halioglobus sp.]|jgi:choline-glycine betaine transporter
MTLRSPSSRIKAMGIDWLTFILSGGFLLLFVLCSLIDIDTLSAYVESAFVWSTRFFGAYWQLLLLANFIIGLILALTRCGKVRLGNLDKPEIGVFKWVSMILCTLLAGGGVFFAAAEPMSHFVAPPPLFDANPSTNSAVYPALAQSFLHWGFMAWAILGSLTTIVLMHLHYDKGLPLKPRTLLYPVFGDRAINSWLGSVVDAACVISVVAGTVGPIGFLGLQVSYGLSVLLGTSDSFGTQFSIILALIGVYTVSTVTGIQRGIQILSKLNIQIAIGLMMFILVAGPTAFIVDSYMQSSALHLSKFFPMATFRSDLAWLDSWTVFFWGWFLGYGPLMAIFIARISRGRSIRQMILSISIISPIITTFWFTIVGGAGLAFELADPGVISIPFDGSNMPAALMAITQQLPFAAVISALFLCLTFLFVATTGDSMTYTISMVMTGNDHPPIPLRIFWGITMGVVAMILVWIGSGGISALQSFIVITAVPVSLILLPSLWAAPKIAYNLGRQQKLI